MSEWDIKTSPNLATRNYRKYDDKSVALKLGGQLGKVAKEKRKQVNK